MKYHLFRAQESFPGLNLAQLAEDDLKSAAGKAAWREFSMRYKDVEDFSLGCLLRLDSSKVKKPSA